MKRYDFDDYARIPEHVSQAYVRAARNLTEEKPMARRKLSVALVLGLVLALAAITAIAAVLLRGRDFVEEVMQPSAQQSEGRSWTDEEVRELLRIAQENGLELSEQQQAQLLAGGGYDKEELMRLFMKLDLGIYPSAWSIEDQAWYAQMLVDIGIYEEAYATLPEEGEFTEAQILEALQAHIHQSDPEAPLDDTSIYRRHTVYQWTPVDDEGEELEKQWYVEYEPLDLTHTAYRFQLDTGANILHEASEPGILNRGEPPTPQALRYRFGEIYGSYEQWDMETWVSFRQLLLEAAEAHGFDGDETLRLLSLSEFALPEQGAITKEAAIEAAAAALLAQEGVGEADLRADKAYAVYLLGGEAPTWKVTVPGAAEGDYVLELDAGTGTARDAQFFPYGTGGAARSFVLESVYQREATKKPAAQEGTLRLDGKRYEAVTPLQDGGYLVVGGSWLGNNTTEAWAARISADGQVAWEVTNDQGPVYQQAVEMSDGTLLLAMESPQTEWFSLAVVLLDAEGNTLSGPVLLEDQGWAYKGKDCLLINKHRQDIEGTQPSTLVAVNAQGERLWEHTYEELYGSGYHPFVVEGGYMLAGGAQDAPYAQDTLWGMVARLDEAGNLLWVRRMEDHPRTGLSAYAGIDAGESGMFAVGSSYDRYEDDTEDYKQLSDFLARFDTEGNLLWCRYYPELDPVGGSLFFGLLPAPEGGVMILTRSFEGTDWNLVRIDAQGEVLARWKPQLAFQDILLEKVFTAGGQGYIIYMDRPENEGTTGPINTYITPVVVPAS